MAAALGDELERHRLPDGNGERVDGSAERPAPYVADIEPRGPARGGKRLHVDDDGLRGAMDARPREEHPESGQHVDLRGIDLESPRPQGKEGPLPQEERAV